jgi:myo-inositol-1(or 4)-monophosphatase
MPSPTLAHINSLAPAVADLAREAGALALRFFQEGAATSARRWTKERGSPVTEADIAVDTFLEERLLRMLPEAGWLSEETADRPDRISRSLVWIVDPIDGTRAFMTGNPDWSIAIGLLLNGRLTLGVVHAPAHGMLYEAAAGAGAFRNGARLQVSSRPSLGGARVTGPKPLIDQLARNSGPIERVARIPSLALRLARVAEGSVDVGLVSADARDWDLAAADLILSEAGGRVTALDGKPLVYNRPEPIHGELAAAPAWLHPSVVAAMRAVSAEGAALR